MQHAQLSWLGCAALSVLSGGIAQAQDGLFDQLDSATEATVSAPARAAGDTPDAPGETAETTLATRSSPFTASALIYGAFAIGDQRDARFLRDEAGLEERGAELRLGYAHDFSPGARLKTELILEAYDARTWEEGGELELRFGESYLHLDIGDAAWMRLGNLKIPHGTADAFPILDLYNPRHDVLWGVDRPGGQTLAVPGAQLVTNFGDFRAQLAFGAGFLRDREAEAGLDHDYHIRDRIGTVIDERYAPVDYEHEWMASLAYFGAGFDLSLLLGEVHEKNSILSGRGVGPGGLQLETDFPRFAFAGLSGAVAMDSWLLRGDLGYFQDQRFFNQDFYTNPIGAPGAFESDVIKAVLGLEYSGISNTILSVEWNRDWIKDWDPGMRSDKISDGVAANAQISLLDDRLDLEFTVASLANHEATILRAGLDYALSDRNSINVQWIDYRSNDADGFMEPYKDADRLFLGWTTSF